MSYSSDDQGLTFLKVAINHKWNGYAMLDTGSQDSILDASLADTPEVPMTSLMVEGQEVMAPGAEYQLETSGVIKKLTGERDLVLLLGSDFFKFENSFITFDPQNGDIYFEKND